MLALLVLYYVASFKFVIIETMFLNSLAPILKGVVKNQNVFECLKVLGGSFYFIVPSGMYSVNILIFEIAI